MHTTERKLPPINLKVTQKYDWVSFSQRKSETTNPHRSKTKISLRKLNLPLTNSSRRGEQESQLNLNTRIEVINRLKLLDTIGGDKVKGNIGPIRQGYLKKLNKSSHPSRKSSQPYNCYLEEGELQSQNFDSYSSSKIRLRKRKKGEDSPDLNGWIHNTFNINFEQRKVTKNHTSVCTTISSHDKRNLESQKKMQSLFELKIDDKYSPTNPSSFNEAESFRNVPSKHIF